MATLSSAQLSDLATQVRLAGDPHAQVLLADDERLRSQLALLRAEYAELLAHARAAVAAARDGELAPLLHVAGFLEERGLLPPADVPARHLVAEALVHSVDGCLAALPGGDRA